MLVVVLITPSTRRIPSIVWFTATMFEPVIRTATSNCPAVSYTASTPLTPLSLELTSLVGVPGLTETMVMALLCSVSSSSMVNFLIFPELTRFFILRRTADSERFSFWAT